MRQPARLGAALAAAGVLLGTSAVALEKPAGEDESLDTCEKRICELILGRDTVGGDVTCEVTKTWGKSSLKKGESKGAAWGFGDARCTAKVTLSRNDVLAAMAHPKYIVKVAPQTVNCVVERSDGVHPVNVTLAPKLAFKGGKADKVWINLKEVQGPADVQGAVWVAANLEDSLGVFHQPLIKSINKFIHTQCPQKHGAGSAAKAESAPAVPASPAPAAKTETAAKP